MEFCRRGDEAKAWASEAGGGASRPPICLSADATTQRSPPPGNLRIAGPLRRPSACASRHTKKPPRWGGFLRVPSWLPNGTCRRIRSGFVINLGEARKRLRPKKLEPPTIVKRLARAEEWQRQIDAGEVSHRAEISRREGVSRARVTQIMHLLKLHPSILDQVRGLTSDMPERQVTERKLRRLTPMTQAEQLRAARSLFCAVATHVVPTR